MAVSHIEKLPNAPLQEVIFELLWDTENDEQGFPVDRDFDFAQGIFASVICKTLPFSKKTILPGTSAVHFILYPMPVHQFWKGENEWPVVQIGPGILVVNDIDANYTWKRYKELILLTLDALAQAYKKEMTFITARLKYIDASQTDNDGIIDNINKSFNLSLQNHFQHGNQPVGVSINQVFPIGDIGNLEVLISNGWSQLNKPALIWQSNIFIEKKMKTNELTTWLDQAHGIVSGHFKKIIKESLYAKFLEAKQD